MPIVELIPALPIVELIPAPPQAPAIESVSDDGKVVVRLARGEKSVLHIPVEQVEQLRRAAFAQYQGHRGAQWARETS